MVCVLPGNGGSGWRDAACCAARLAAVVEGLNSVFEGAGCGVPGTSASESSCLKVARPLTGR